MTWPATPNFGLTHVDAGSDNPSLARQDIHDAMEDLQNVIEGRGQASGVASLDSTTKIPLAQLPQLLGATNVVTFTDEGSDQWTVPAGVTRVLVECWGGGGGGGFSNVTNGAPSPGWQGDHGGGGGAGGGALKILQVTPGEDLDITVGAGGAGGATGGDNPGSNGGATSVDYDASTICSASGGSGGGHDGNGAFGGAGGAGSIGDLLLYGGAGHGGSTRGGIGGGNMRSGGGNGASGQRFGGGGSGSGGAFAAGQDGAIGGVIIWY